MVARGEWRGEQWRGEQWREGARGAAAARDQAGRVTSAAAAYRVRDVGLLELTYLILAQLQFLGGERILQAAQLGCAHDGRRHTGPVQQPGERDLHGGRTALSGHLPDPIHDV